MDTGKKKQRSSDIDAHLKRAFRELEQEALPERLTELLNRLRSQDQEADEPSSEDGEAPSARQALQVSAGGGRA